MKTFKSFFKEQEPEKKKKKESGDTWETKPGIWGGKNPDGEIEYYSGEHGKEMSRAWAKDKLRKEEMHLIQKN